jgi:protein-tyrosine phosphatase
MAEFIFKDILSKKGLQNKFIISSSATSTEEIWNGIGNPVYPPAKRILAQHGISCEGKKAVQLKRDDYDKYDYFIGMDRANIRNMHIILGVDRSEKIYKLMDFTDRPGDVADPWYSGNFDITFKDVTEGCEALLDFLLNK